jgi:nucleoside recognition membrane protein YjiH
MDSLVKSDIFFFITSVVVIVIGVGAVIVYFYVINILRDVKDVSKTVKDETKEMAEDISQLRTKVKTGSVVVGLVGFFRKLFAKSKKGRNHKKGE